MRYTTKEHDDIYSFNEKDMENIVKKLGKYEDMYDYIVEDTRIIMGKMEILKAKGDNKSCQFKELMVRKMTNNNIIAALKIHSVELI